LFAFISNSYQKEFAPMLIKASMYPICQHKYTQNVSLLSLSRRQDSDG
jgi:hypothetical protein